MNINFPATQTMKEVLMTTRTETFLIIGTNIETSTLVNNFPIIQ